MENGAVAGGFFEAISSVYVSLLIGVGIGIALSLMGSAFDLIPVTNLYFGFIVLLCSMVLSIVTNVKVPLEFAKVATKLFLVVGLILVLSIQIPEVQTGSIVLNEFYNGFHNFIMSFFKVYPVLASIIYALIISVLSYNKFKKRTHR